MKTKNILKTGLVSAALVACLSAALPTFDLRNINPSEMVDIGKKVVKAVQPMKENEEIQLGRELAARLAGTFGVWKDQAWTEEVNVLGRVLVPYSDRPNLKYRFAIMNTDDVNAYSAPGGYIFISKGLLKQLDSEAELAGVLAHEIAHVANKDIVREVQNSNVWKAGASVAVASSNMGGMEQQLLQDLTNASWDYLVVKGLSKGDELKADEDGAEYAQKLGYDPYGIYNFVAKLEPSENNPDKKLKTFMGTHPKPSTRMNELKKYYEQHGWSKGSLPDDSEQFKSFKQKHPIP
jgi:beta-barrel assembly-enhancing protease